MQRREQICGKDMDKWARLGLTEGLSQLDGPRLSLLEGRELKTHTFVMPCE